MKAGRTVRHYPRLAMSTRITEAGDVVVSVAGELDIATADQLIEIVSTVIDRHGPDVAIDLDGVPFCDATGLRALIVADLLAQARNGGVRVVNPPPSLIRILRISDPWRRRPGSRPAGRRRRPGGPAG